MDLYRYPYPGAIKTFVLLDILENDEVLVYSLERNRFAIILGSIFEHCEVIEENYNLTYDELKNEYVKMLERTVNPMLLQACSSYFDKSI